MKKYTISILMLSLGVFSMMAEGMSQKAETLEAAGTKAMSVIMAPEGTYKYYSLDEYVYDNGKWNNEEGLVTTVVFGSDNKIYFKDIFPLYNTSNFVEGTLGSDGIVTIPVPQLVSDNLANQGLPGMVVLFQKNPNYVAGNENSDLYVISDIDHIDYIYDAEADSFTLSLPGEENEYMVGYSLAIGTGAFLDEGFTQQVLTPFKYKVPSMPEGIPEQMYMFSEHGTGYPVYLAQDGNDLYIRGISERFPYGVIKATIDGDVAYIAQDQIVGTAYGWVVYTKCWNATEGEWAEDNSINYELQIDWNNQTIYNLSGWMEDYTLVLLSFMPGLTGYLYYEEFDDFNISVPQLEGVPETPYDADVQDLDQEIQFGFEIPTVTTEGNVLAVNDLYYRVYVDGELYEFIPDLDLGEYVGLDGPTTEIPFNLSNDIDIISAYYNMRFIRFYFTGVTTFGVQSVYKYGGKVTESDILVLNVETGNQIIQPAGIESLLTPAEASVSYYDLTGRKVNRPGKGIYVVKRRGADGNTVTTKEYVR